MDLQKKYLSIRFSQIVSFTFFFCIPTLVAEYAFAVTPNFYKCVAREGGDWTFGRLPYVCLAQEFGDDQVLIQDYSTLIFRDFFTRDHERNRYIQEMDSVIKESAQYYIKSRNPSVSTEELQQWTLLVELTAAHETKMSHYRQTSDRKYKMMRGDYGHGHGMMQVDDRHHFNAIELGIGWNLITNLSYGMDILYEQWKRAPKQSCVGQPQNWKARIRSTWAAFNGGPSSICRWTNPNSAYSANDKNFLDMYNNRTWKQYVQDPNHHASVDIPCLMENHQNCPAPGETTQDLTEGQLYKLNNRSLCIYLNGNLQCVKSNTDAICLNSLGDVNNSTVKNLDPRTSNKINQIFNDRHSLCSHYDATLISVGKTIKTIRAINLRSTAGGGLLTTLPENWKGQVLDFEIHDSTTKDRYYKVQFGGQIGYIYAGNSDTYHQWVETNNNVLAPSAKQIAQEGDIIKITAPSGINLRQSPNGKKLITLAQGAQLKILDYLVQDEDNEIYYRINYKEFSGYIYSGSLKPISTTQNWTQIIK